MARRYAQRQVRRFRLPRDLWRFGDTPQFPWIFHAIISMTGFLFLARAIWK